MEKVVLFDDLDSQPADESMQFAFDGENYRIDLSAAHAQAFREVVEPFRQAARRLGKHKVTARGAGRKPARPAAAKASKAPVDWYKSVPGEPVEVAGKKKAYRARVRTWASDQGDYDLGSRGAIPEVVHRAYEAWAAEHGVETGPESVGL